MLKVLNPTVGPARGHSGIAPRPASLDDKTIGVIWNGRAYGDRILQEALGLLKQRYRIRDVLFREKPFLGNIAPEPILAELAAKADVVITGVGD
ncbi:MAG: hypothetical protein Q8P98_05230 [Candidatus Rokubacteria bacterium]|nr:hypothetical protein [Candidatus Rokubacteria bacterium]